MSTDAIDPAIMEAMRNGEAPPAPTPEAPAPDLAAPIDAAPEVLEDPAAPLEEAAPKRGNPEVPIRQLRQQLQSYERLLSDPQALANYARANGFNLAPQGTAADAANVPAPDANDPFAAFDPESAQALRSVLDTTLKPLQDKLAAAEAQQQQAQRHADLLALEQEHPGLIHHVRAFDSVMPDMAHADPMVKHLTMLGNRMTDPTQRGAVVQEMLDQMDPAEVQQLLQPLIQNHAVSLVADKLVGGNAGKQQHVTLGGALPARDNAAPKPLSDISTQEWQQMTDAEQERYRNG